MYTDKRQFMDPYLERGLLFGWKNTSICNLQNFSFFFQYRARILPFFTPCKIWNMFKINNEDTRIPKVNNKFKNKDVLLPVLLALNTSYSVFIVDFDQLIAGLGCCLLSWRFVPAGTNLGKVSTYGETR